MKIKQNNQITFKTREMCLNLTHILKCSGTIDINIKFLYFW